MFRAYDAARERLVAVKLFTVELTPDRVQRLVDRLEQLIASNLTHPAIVGPLAAGISGASAYFAHDFVAGESLDLAIREYGPAPAADALRVAAQMAAALDFAAAAGVYHGALHPRDVLLAADDTRVTGFGIAQSLELVGVPSPVRRPYSAPERMAGTEWDRRADIFSLATLIYELISGRRVSETGTAASVSFDDIPNVDADALRRVFARALADNRTDRYQTALSFVSALENAFGQASTEKTTPRGERDATLPPEAADLPLTSDADDVAETGPVRFDAIAGAEQERYRDVEVAPAIVGGAADRSPLAAGTLGPVGVDERRGSEPPAPVLIPDRSDRARSPVWPLLAALGIGAAVGFAGGYGVGVQDRSPSVRVEPAAHEFTESAVPEAKAEVRPNSDTATTSPAATPGIANSGVRVPPSSDRGQGGREGDARPDSGPVVPKGPRGNDTPTRSNAETRLKRDATTARARGSASEATSTGPGRLLVRSTPAGARVSIDGRDAGVTPAVVRDLARGSHHVRVTRDGYLTEERRIVITPRREAVSITVGLSPAVATNGPFVGNLTVQSRPTRAKVFLDGQLIGTTPLLVPSVRAGEHAILLEYDGYRRWSSVVRVVANEANRVTASLER